ncbi:Hpt domain-containing protein [Tsuneonella sp. YG55]|uniref:Hpt domain-containing protein n=1 Tax=Tsuneonella litorea TaxID=2976475 RepID=A0A9X2W1D0_9SPHN|nr:Hpt domain-containing protein [Tsuneonella litorea]MCT2558429.1 Hpt domain-containing protein [Tsuneonella litorea]
MNDIVQAKLAELGRRFAAQAPERRTALRAALDEGDLPALATLAHRLAGNAGMFGYPAISEAAFAVEQAIDEERDPTEPAAVLMDLLGAV